MQFGLYAPIPMATVGSPEVAQAVSEALSPLPPGRLDAQFDLGIKLLEAADEVGFELVLFAERHPYAGGPEHYAAYLANTDNFEVELVAIEP